MHHRHMWFELSPSQKSDEKRNGKQDSIPKPILQLTHFSPAVRLDFGTVFLGKSKLLSFSLHNPHELELNITVPDCKPGKNPGFSVNTRQFKVGAGNTESLEILWNPTDLGKHWFVLHLRTDHAGQNFRVTLTGDCQKPCKKRKVKSSFTLSHLSSKRLHYKTNEPVSCYPQVGKNANDITTSFTSGKEKSATSHSTGDQENSVASGNKHFMPLILYQDEVDLKFAEQDYLHPLPSTPVRRETFLVREPDSAERHPLRQLQSSQQSLEFYTNGVQLKLQRSPPLKTLEMSRTVTAEVLGENRQMEIFDNNLCATEGDLLNNVSFINRKCRGSMSSQEFEDSLVSSSDRRTSLPTAVSPTISKQNMYFVEGENGFFLDFDAEDQNRRETIVIKNKLFGEPPTLGDFSGDDGTRENLRICKEMNGRRLRETSKSIAVSSPIGTLSPCDESLSATHNMSSFMSRMKLMENMCSDLEMPETAIQMRLPEVASPVRASQNLDETFLFSQRPLLTIPEECCNAGRKLDTNISDLDRTFITSGKQHLSESNHDTTMLKMDETASLQSNFVPINSHVVEIAHSVHKNADVSAAALTLENRNISWVLSSPYDRDDRQCSTAVKRRPTKTEETRECGQPLKSKIKKSLVKTVASKQFKKGIAQKKLTLIQPAKANILRHPNPHFAQNMFYDEDWIKKQQVAFSRWMNFVLMPTNDANSTNNNAEVNAAKLWAESLKSCKAHRAPTKEECSFHAYTAGRQMNKLRRSAGLLLQSKEMANVIFRVETEIALKRLSVREDRGLHADFGIKQDILNMLLCYNTLWLRLGLEMVFGELIPLKDNCDVVGLSTFIVTRFLYCPVLAAKYSHPTVPHFLRAGFEEKLKAFVLKKFLVLVYVLDKAKCKHLVEHDPCLFRKDAPIKSSKDLLLTFSMNYLKGEGDLVRHLRLLGYQVLWEQKTREEFDFSVVNIAVDLRCGLRIARVLELLLHSYNLTEMMRCPAHNKLHKISNMEIVFKELVRLRVITDSTITARDIVNGHKEKTLRLLWALILKTQVDPLLDNVALCREICFAMKRLSFLRCQEAAVGGDCPSALSIYNQAKRDCIQPDSLGVALLLKWCQAICSQYYLKVENLASSFSDGRALCYIIHHYHPDILPIQNIHVETSQSIQKSMDDSFIFEALSPKSMQKALQNEKANLSLAFEAMKSLGGIPQLTEPAFMSNTIPDEKVVVTLMAYLQKRLITLSEEISAARVIQLAWRQKLLQRQLEIMKKKEQAAKIVQFCVRAFLERRRLARKEKAALLIQCMWRRYKSRRRFQELRMKAVLAQQCRMATIIQTYFRGYAACKKYQKLKKSAEFMQWTWRAKRARKCFLRKKAAAVQIQSHFRALHARRQFLSYRTAVITIQLHYRSRLALRKQMQEYSNIRKAIITLQSFFCMVVERRRYLNLKRAIYIIESYRLALVATRRDRKNFLHKKSSAIIIQRFFRRHAERIVIRKKREAVLVIQNWFKSYLVMKRYQKVKSATIRIQYFYRSCILTKTHREKFLRFREATIVLQSHYKGRLVRQEYLRKKHAALVIQKSVRAWSLGSSVRKDYLMARSAIIRCQSVVRGYLARKQLERFHKLAAVLQAIIRGYLCRMYLAKCSGAAVVLQKHFRRYLHQKRFTEMKRSTILIQKAYRRHLAKQMYLKKIVLVQSFLRMKIARAKYLRVRGACVKIQANYRMHLSRRRIACIVIQRALQKFRLRQQMKNLIFQRQTRAACIIQRCWRLYIASKNQREAALKIQMWYRRMKFSQKRTVAAIKVQSFFRMLLCKNSYTLKKKEGTCRYLEIQNDHHAMAAIVIQKNIRRFLVQKAVKKLHYQHEEQRAAVVVIQRAFRKWLENCQERRRLSTAARTIQAMWRGYRQRKQEKNCQLALIRNRLSDAMEAATEDKTLHYKTSRAIHILLNCKQVTRICVALVTLDRVTALDWRSCERIGEAGLTTTLINIINSCNRSLAHIEIITNAFNVLLNLAKYEETVHYVWEADGIVDTILSVMKIYSDKEGTIFPKLCTLLFLLLKKLQKAQVFLRNKQWIGTVTALYENVTKRETMIAAKQQSSGKASRNTLSVSQITKCTPSLSCTFRRSPNFHPAWRLNRFCTSEFETPLVAITAVMNVINLKQ